MLSFLLADVLLVAGAAARDVLLARAGCGAGAGSSGGGDETRFGLGCFDDRPTLFLVEGTSTGAGGSGWAGAVLILLEPRVK